MKNRVANTAMPVNAPGAERLARLRPGWAVLSAALARAPGSLRAKFASIPPPSSQTLSILLHKAASAVCLHARALSFSRGEARCGLFLLSH